MSIGTDQEDLFGFVNIINLAVQAGAGVTFFSLTDDSTFGHHRK